MSAIHELEIGQAVWLFPLAVGLHFVEEAPAFAKWARQYISPLYTDGHWRRVHATGAVAALLAAAAVSEWPGPVTIFLFTAFFVAPMVFNAIFHVAASIWVRCYSPGAVSATLLFPALAGYLVWLACDAHLLNALSASAAAILGGAFHALDLSTTTFFIRRVPRRSTASTPRA